MREVLLIIHLVAVSLWLGGSVMHGVITTRMASSGSLEARTHLARIGTMLGTTFYMPMAVLTLLSGIGLVLLGDAYSFGDLFVSVGFLAIIVAAVLGPVKFKPLSERVVEAYAAGDEAGGDAASRQIMTWSTVNTTLILVALVLMVLKPGS